MDKRVRFLNDAPFYTVPNLFSYQHILLLLLSATYVIGMCFLFKRFSFKGQKIGLIVIMSACVLLFAGRMFFGFEGARLWNDGGKTTLLPLELCNLNIFVTLAGVIANKKLLNNFLYYISVTGAAFSLTIFPPVHMNIVLFKDYMFLDYYIIHTQLVAVPIIMIACRWFTPELKKIPAVLVMTLCIYFSLFLISLGLRNLKPFEGANFMYVLRHNDLPILKQLYSVIPLPFVYGLPLAVPVSGVLCLEGLPFYLSKRRAQKKAAAR